MISSSSSSHRSTVPQGTVTYPVTAGSTSAETRTSSAGNAKCGRLPVRYTSLTRSLSTTVSSPLMPRTLRGCTSTNVTCAGGSKSNRPVGRRPNGPPPTVRVMRER